MYRFYLALRYLLSRPINLLGMMGVAVSVAALIVVVSIFSGYLEQVEKHVHSVTSDLTVIGCEREADVAATLDSDPNVAAWAPRIVHFGLLHPLGGSSNAPAQSQALASPGPGQPIVSLFGIDARREAEVNDFAEWLRSGEDDALHVSDPTTPFAARAPDAPAPILLSEKRMHEQGIDKGTEIKITTARITAASQRQALSLLPARFRAEGSFATRHTAFDAQSCFVPIDVLRAGMDAGAPPDAATQIAVRCRDPELRFDTARRLERQLNHNRSLGTKHMLVRTWDQMEAHFLSAVEHQRSLMKLVLIVILVVAAFLMYATLSMMVTEKTFDIGILTAMGATRRGVLQVFLTCGLAITGAGTLLGIVLGCLTAVRLDAINRWLRMAFDLDLFPTRIYNLDHVPYHLDGVWIAQVAVMAFGVGLLVSGLPAWRAARHDPLHSLRQE